MAEIIKQENKYTEITSDPEDDEEKPAEGTIDLSKLELPGVRRMDRDVVICKDLRQVQSMFETKNLLKGFKPLE